MDSHYITYKMLIKASEMDGTLEESAEVIGDLIFDLFEKHLSSEIAELIVLDSYIGETL